MDLSPAARRQQLLEALEAWVRSAKLAELARRWGELPPLSYGAVDLFGIEDWMGLQYMYGPDFTWEGFQLMGFQAAMFRSGLSHVKSAS